MGPIFFEERSRILIWIIEVIFKGIFEFERLWVFKFHQVFVNLAPDGCELAIGIFEVRWAEAGLSTSRKSFIPSLDFELNLNIL